MRKSICTFCSVGCTVAARVANGVWLSQEPAFESPFNRGSHCAKGAAAREVTHGDRRLKYPLKLLNGYWVRVSWDTALDEIGQKLAAIRDASGPDSGSITKIGDATVRWALYEASHLMITRPIKGGALKSWAVKLAKRVAVKKAAVALARKLAVILRRMWVDGTPFKFA